MDRDLNLFIVKACKHLLIQSQAIALPKNFRFLHIHLDIGRVLQQSPLSHNERIIESSEQLFNANMFFFFFTLLYTGWVLQGVQNLLLKAEHVQSSPQWVTRSPDPARLHLREGKLCLGIHLPTDLSRFAKTEGYCNLSLQKNMVFILPLNCWNVTFIWGTNFWIAFLKLI